jgi:hypothetical protein
MSSATVRAGRPRGPRLNGPRSRDTSRGYSSVIDEDLASAILAEQVGADLLVIATHVPGSTSSGQPRRPTTWGRSRLRS